MKQLFENQGKTVKVFGETAQIYIDKHEGKIEDRYDFEKYIMQEEKKRLAEIQEIKTNKTYDIVLTDRTFLDAFVYTYRGILHGTIKNPDILAHTEEIESSKHLYDVVVFFDTMITPDKNFADYNEQHINEIFRHSMQSIYQDNFVYYPNNKEFEKDIDIFVKKYLQ